MLMTQAEYIKAMKEAIIEFNEWEATKRKTRKVDKERFRAERLAKLDMRKIITSGEF